MSKSFLKVTTLVMIGIGVLAVAYIFLGSMNPTDSARAKSIFETSIKHLSEGKLVKVDAFRRPLYIFKPTSEQLADIEYLDDHVWDTQYSGYAKEYNVFVYYGFSTRFGCMLESHQKGEKRFSYSNRTWMGGYFDPCHDSSYDYAGRTIKTYKYSANGYTSEVPNLFVPDFKIINDKLTIYRLDQ